MPNPNRMPKSMLRKSADAYGSPAKKKGVSKATYKSGGLYSTGRAITQAPGTKKNSRVTTPKPSKSASKGRKGSTAMRGADAYGNPANRNTNKKYR